MTYVYGTAVLNSGNYAKPPLEDIIIDRRGPVSYGSPIGCIERDIYWTYRVGLLLVAYPFFPLTWRCGGMSAASGHGPLHHRHYSRYGGGGVLPITSPWYWLTFSVPLFSFKPGDGLQRPL